MFERPTPCVLFLRRNGVRSGVRCHAATLTDFGQFCTPSRFSSTRVLPTTPHGWLAPWNLQQPCVRACGVPHIASDAPPAPSPNGSGGLPSPGHMAAVDGPMQADLTEQTNNAATQSPSRAKRRTRRQVVLGGTQPSRTRTAQQRFATLLSWKAKTFTLAMTS